MSVESDLVSAPIFEVFKTPYRLRYKPLACAVFRNFFFGRQPIPFKDVLKI